MCVIHSVLHSSEVMWQRKCEVRSSYFRAYTWQWSAVAECQQLTPIILTIWEAEIQRIIIQSQPGQMVQETLSPK
jgi:hypothetical protein